MLSAEISRIAVFGDFSKDDLFEIEKEGKRVVQFFCMKSDLAREMTLPPEVIFVALNTISIISLRSIKNGPNTPNDRDPDRAAVGELRQRLLEVREELARYEADLRTFLQCPSRLAKRIQ